MDLKYLKKRQITFLSGLLMLLNNKNNINLSNIHVSLKTHPYICTYMLLNATKNTACQVGYYGKDCTGRCSIHCYYTSLCDRFTGLCTRGCKAGWTGNMCDRRNFCFYIYMHTCTT